MSETSLVQHVTNIEAGDSVVACAFLGRTPVYALADGTLLYAGIGEEKRVKAHEDAAILVALADGKRFFTGGDDGLLVATDAEGRSETIADEKGKWIDALTLRADGAMAWSAGKSVRARDSKGEVKSFDAPSAVRGLAWRSSGYAVSNDAGAYAASASFTDAERKAMSPGGGVGMGKTSTLRQPSTVQTGIPLAASCVVAGDAWDNKGSDADAWGSTS